VQVSAGIRGGIAVPQQVDEALDRNDGARLEKEQRQQAPFAPAAELEPLTVPFRLNAAKKPKNNCV
jgi:hypothetical protein